MLYYWRSERYSDIIHRHNDAEYQRRDGFYDSGSDSEDGSTCSDSDSSLDGRRKFKPTRFTHAGSRVPKKYRTRWRDTV